MTDQADGFESLTEAIEEADEVAKQQQIEENKKNTMVQYPLLTFPEWEAIQTVVAAALFGFWPELWIKNPTDDAIYHMQRQIIAEAMLARAENYFKALGPEGANALREKLKGTAESAFNAIGLDPAALYEKTSKFMESLGLRVKRYEYGPDETTITGEAVAGGDTPEDEAGRGSEPESGPGEDLA